MKWLPGLRRTEKQLRGDAGEDAALAYLQKQGLVLVERNFRCKGGEIDLVMREGTVLVFVEVRLRADANYGGAAASVTYSKQRRILVAAQTYLQRCSHASSCRIDVVALDGAELSWIKNAVSE
ncbi:MAG: archaeal Holliday junction resolvase-like protein [Paucimonas sp.]|jgi:putative endonuclease|nr:archaeal Holliday junction resolvase-like protein [Paucimonas sp.]